MRGEAQGARENARSPGAPAPTHALSRPAALSVSSLSPTGAALPPSTSSSTAVAAAATPSSSRSFACNAGLGRPPPPEVVIAYGPDRLDAFLAAADELEDRFPGLVVTGVEYAGGAGAGTAFEVAPPRPARPGGEGGEEPVASGAGPTLWSGLALGRAPEAGEVATLLAAAGVGGGGGQNPADGIGCGG